MTKKSTTGLKLFNLMMTFIFLFLGQSEISIAESSETLSENKIKAALIFNFINFTRWPESSFENSNTPYRICIADNKNYPDIFNIISTQSIHQRKIEVKQIEPTASLEIVKDCQVVFILLKNNYDKKEILKIINKLPILTIAESDNKNDSLAMVNLIKEEESIGFIINRTQAKMSGIEFSSKMLRLAINVIGDN